MVRVSLIAMRERGREWGLFVALGEGEIKKRTGGGKEDRSGNFAHHLFRERGLFRNSIST